MRKRYALEGLCKNCGKETMGYLGKKKDYCDQDCKNKAAYERRINRAKKYCGGTMNEALLRKKVWNALEKLFDAHALESELNDFFEELKREGLIIVPMVKK